LVPLTGGFVGLGLIELVLVFTFVLVFTSFVLVLTLLVLVLRFLVLVLGFLVLVLTFLVLVFSLVLDVLVSLPPPLVVQLPRLTSPGRPVTTGREVEPPADTVRVTVTVWTLYHRSTTKKKQKTKKAD